nr:hypothetical protein [Tanacetum cinerariifolium]
MQTQTSNALHNAIMEEGGKDRPPMLALGIDNDIYSTVDACPNACEIWFYKMMNKLIRNQCDVTNHQVNVQFLLQLETEWKRSQLAATRLKEKAIVNSSSPTYDQEPAMVAKDDEITSSNTNTANQENSPRINRRTGYDNQRVVNVARDRENVGTQDATYYKEKMLLCKQEEAGVQLNAKQADWKDETDDKPDDQELEAHYTYMAQIQEVTPDAAKNFGPIFDTEPLQKVQNDDDKYNVFANDKEHLEQPESVNDTYLEEQVNEIIDERLARTANPLALVAQQQPVYHPQNHPNHYTQNCSTISQPAATKNRGKSIINSSSPTYDQEPTMVAEDNEISKENEIDKLMALISLSFKKINKPTNNNL